MSTTSLLDPQYGSVEKHFLFIIRSLVYATMKRTMQPLILTFVCTQNDYKVHAKLPIAGRSCHQNL